MYARFAVTDHHSLQMWMHISEHTMVTLRVYFARFVSKFLKLQHHTYVIIDSTRKSFHQCSKCRLQFLTCKEKREHKTQCHQMFKKPKQLEGLPPETKVVIQVSLEPLQPGLVEVASITVNASDSEPSPPKSKSRRSKKPG